jgi:hypothetical protein
MGCSVSWVFLNLIHMALVSYSQSGRIVNNEGLVFRNKVIRSFQDKTYKICGDDLVAIWSVDRIQRYEAIMRSTGAKFS